MRLDILVAVSYLCKRVQFPTDGDKQKLIRVIQYVRGTPDLGINLEASKNVSIISYVDASYGVLDDLKSHTVFTVGIGKGPIYAEKVVRRKSIQSLVPKLN